MKHLSLLVLLIFAFACCAGSLSGQETLPELTDSIAESSDQLSVGNDDGSLHQTIKIKFIEGSALFMSFIALTLIVGLAFCLERIIYLYLALVNTGKLL
jgi:biopolymer transport protein ExbB